MTFVILTPFVVLVFALADKILLLFGGSYSESATELLRFLSVAAFPLAINNVYLGIKRVEKKLKTIVGLTVTIASLTLGLSLLFPISVAIIFVSLAVLKFGVEL